MVFTQQPLSHNTPCAGTPLAFYSKAAPNMTELSRQCEADAAAIELKKLVEVLTSPPSLPPHMERELMIPEQPMWNFISAHFLDARRALFMWHYTRGILPIRHRTFVSATSGLADVCPLCGTRETPEHVFYDCLLPAALLQRMRDLFKLPGIPCPTFRLFNPLPNDGCRQFVLTIAKINYQVWIARCRAAYSTQTPSLHEVKGKIRNSGSTSNAKKDTLAERSSMKSGGDP